VLQLASSGADAFYTNRNMTSRFPVEHDPLSRPFVIHGTSLRIAYFAGGEVFTLALAEYLRRKNHPNLETGVRVEQILNNSSGAAYSAMNYSYKKGGAN
jgi:hypothetical protein